MASIEFRRFIRNVGFSRNVPAYCVGCCTAFRLALIRLVTFRLFERRFLTTSWRRLWCLVRDGRSYVSSDPKSRSALDSSSSSQSRSLRKIDIFFRWTEERWHPLRLAITSPLTASVVRPNNWSSKCFSEGGRLLTIALKSSSDCRFATKDSGVDGRTW